MEVSNLGPSDATGVTVTLNLDPTSIFNGGLSDPIAGYLSDRTRSRLGRRRSWLAASALPFGLTLLMLWSPPASLQGPWIAAWVGFALFLFYTTY